MKKIVLVQLLTGFALAFGLQAQSLATSGNHCKLKRILKVEGRQGIAVDKQYYYVSSSTALYKYTKEGQLISKNEEPFRNLQKKANHFVDIDVHDNIIYTGIEWFEGGVDKDIQIALYDAETLQYIEYYLIGDLVLFQEW